MSGIVAIGERERIQGFAFAGVRVIATEDAESIRAAWRRLPAELELVILTAAAHAALSAEQLTREEAPLAVVMPG